MTILEEAEQLFISLLPKEPGYIKNRVPRKTIEKYNIGYADFEWFKTLGTTKELIEAGLVSNRTQWPLFINRMMIPIKNAEGKTIAFGGRRIDENSNSPKYINSPTTPYYQKKENLFGLNYVSPQTTAPIILCEGYMDCIALQSKGFNGVASLGTALTREQVLLLKHFNAPIHLAYDQDIPGQNATKKNLILLSSLGIEAKVVHLSYKDPDDEIKNNTSSLYRVFCRDVETDISYMSRIAPPNEVAKFILEREVQKYECRKG